MDPILAGAIAAIVGGAVAEITYRLLKKIQKKKKQSTAETETQP